MWVLSNARRCLVISCLLILSQTGFAQHRPGEIADGTEGEVLPLADSAGRKAHPNRWNFVNAGISTIKLGVAFLYEYNGFSQDDIAKRQMDSAKVDLRSGFDVRDFRAFLSGKFKTKRLFTWRAGLMYDGSLNSWLIRETGFTIGLPELSGSVFIGRTKEGFSLSKVMSGYAVEMMERHMASDAIPILSDGIKFMGFLPKSRLLWNLGAYADWTSRNQGFSTFSSTFTARIGWLAVYSPEEKTLLHVALNSRYAQPDDDKIRIRSRPEANIAPFFVDSGEFPTTGSTSWGGEAYFSRGPFMLGSEYFFHGFRSAQAGDPVFNGGEVMFSYVLTGESRPYIPQNGIYGFMPIDRPVFKGGPGAWEMVLRLSSMDLDDGNQHGGKFWKITPMVNWYLSEYFRFEAAYGYGILNRFELSGATHFFQTRLQFTIR